MAEWFEDLFDDDYLRFYPEVLEGGSSEEEAAFVDRTLALRPGSRLLDLGCGVGRHAVPLAALGHAVTGVELSAAMLAHAEDAARSRGLELDLVRRDMRDLAGLGPFDACLCLYTVFGYFSDEENAAVLLGVRDVLVPSGQLLLDVTNPLALYPHWPGTSWREVDAGIAREESHYDPLHGRLEARRTLFGRDGARRELPSSSVRMYLPHEVEALLEESGFDVEGLHGSYGPKPFAWKSSQRQIWAARKR